jgi:hypothetical protein
LIEITPDFTFTLLYFDNHTGLQRFNTGAHIWHTINPHIAGRAVPDSAPEATRSFVNPAVGQNPDSSGMQRSGYRFTFTAFHFVAVKFKCYCFPFFEFKDGVFFDAHHDHFLFNCLNIIAIGMP